MANLLWKSYGVLGLSLAALVALPACDTMSPTSIASACESNNTATVTFANKSASNRTYTIVWDGATLETITPGTSGPEHTVAAGIQHTLVFRYTNTSQNACSPSTPTLAQCSTHEYSCAS